MRTVPLVLATLIVVPSLAAAGDKVKVVATTQAQEKLAHFVTDDGMHGFILDRSTATPKLKVDGDKAIIELTMEEDRTRGELVGYRYRSPDGKQRIYISKHGGIKFFHKGDEHRVTFDKTVSALGAATVKGKYVPEVPAYETFGKALTAISVRTKQPAMTSEDASNLTKVTEAFKSASAAMFVRYNVIDGGWAASLRVATVDGAGYGGNDYATDDAETKRHKLLAKHGAIIRGYSSPETPQGNHLKITRAGETPKLADNTPGLIWEVDGTSAIFVTMDGARYSVSLSHDGGKVPAFEIGAGTEADWPKKPFDTYLDYSMISALAKVKALPQTAVDELVAIDGEWTKCTAKGWPAIVKKAENDRNMTVGKAKTMVTKMHTSCNKAIDKYEKAIVKQIEARAKARAAVLTAASAAAKSAK